MKGGVILALIGVILIIVGAGLTAYAYASPTKTQESVTGTQPLISYVTFTLQATQPPWVLSTQLKSGQEVNGTFGLTNFTSSEGPVFFYVQNETELVNWGKCSPCAWPTIINDSATSSGTYTFSWKAPATGAYYFTFDPEYYNATIPAYFDANTTSSPTTITVTSLNTSLIYGGVGLAIIGAVLAAVGLVISSSSRARPKTNPNPLSK